MVGKDMTNWQSRLTSKQTAKYIKLRMEKYPELMAWLKKTASDHNCTMQTLIREILMDAMKESGQTITVDH